MDDRPQDPQTPRTLAARLLYLDQAELAVAPLAGLSPKGCSLWLARPPRLGAHVEVELRLDLRRWVRVAGTVVQAFQDGGPAGFPLGIDVEFSCRGPEETRLLRQIEQGRRALPVAVS
jgi:hypothetical protein